MTMRVVLIIALLCSACSTVRKVSESGLRAPAALDGSTDVADRSLAQRDLLLQNAVPETCPENTASVLQNVIKQKIVLPSCPQGYYETLHQSLDLLRLEERSLLEELMNQRCQALTSNQLDDRLRAFMSSFDSLGPLGRRKSKAQGEREDERDFQVLNRLRTQLELLLQSNVVLEVWISRHGNYIVPESHLRLLQRAIFDGHCAASDVVLEEAYRAIDTLEELRRIMPDPQQVQYTESLISILFTIADEKVLEFFSQQKGTKR